MKPFKSFIGERKPVIFMNDGASKTKQSFRDECDITRIVNRFHQTGQLPPSRKQPIFADVSAMGDYRDMIHRQRLGRALFSELSAEERAAFSNDPAQYLLWIEENASRFEGEGAVKAPSSPREAAKPTEGSP